LGSRRDDFVWFKTEDGKLYGLAEQHPERKKELDKKLEPLVQVPTEESSEIIKGKLKHAVLD